MNPARHRPAPALPLLLCGAALVLWLVNLLWTDSVDLAHHYALVVRLGQQWHLAGAFDPSLGEMSQYPRGAHQIAALAGTLGGSPLLGIQLTALAAFVAIWIVLLQLLRQLPPRAAALSALSLAVLLLLNRAWLGLELHGGEIVANFFFSQLVGQALVLLAVLATLRMEQAGMAPPWRYALLLVALPVACAVHLLPATELAALLGLSALADLLPGRRGGRRQTLLSLLAPAAGALLLYTHPSFAIMKQISANNGGMPTNHLDSMTAFAVYAAAVALLAGALLRSWLRMAPARAAQALGLKYIGLYGMACALMCLLQLLALACGAGSAYAVKKYAFALHSAMLLELCLLPALLLAWHRNVGAEQLNARPGAAPPPPRWLAYDVLCWPALLALAVASIAPAAPQARLAPLLRLERQFAQLRETVLPATPQHATYVTQIPGLSPSMAYMFTVGTFATPRSDNAYDIMGGQGPRNTRSVDTILTHPDSPYGRIPGCRRAGGNATLALMDGPCVDRVLHPPGSHLDLGLGAPAQPCTLTGLSEAEHDGRWTELAQATIDCPRPLLNGRLARSVTLETHALLEHVALQRLSLSLNGGPAQPFRYDRGTPARRLVLPLPADADPNAPARRIVLRLSLPDARSALELGLGPDGRRLGIMISTIDFD